MKAILLGILLLLTATAAAVDFHVSPKGSDANPGTADQPFATLARARDAVRALKAKGPLAEPVRVIVADGTYTLTEPLVLSPEDSGTAQAPVTLPRRHPARGRCSAAGACCSGWKQADERSVDGARFRRWPPASGTSSSCSSTAAGPPAPARPNKFYYHIQDVQQTVLDAGGSPRKPKQARQTLRMRPEDFQQALGKVRPEDLRDVNLVVYHNWDNTRRFLDSVDPEQATLVTSGEGMKSWNPWRRNCAVPSGELPARRWTRPANGSWPATARCPTSRCPART